MIGSDLNEKYDKLVTEMARMSAAMEAFEFPKTDQQHSPGYREWERFDILDGGTCDGSGNKTLTFERPCAPPGWEAFLTTVAVTVSGASTAATITNYTGDAADQNLFDYANAMLGNSPSRLSAFYDWETVYFHPNRRLTVVVAGAVASATVIVRASGKRRQT